jgi:hypothetical protein
MLALLAQAELQALFIWSALHGMASIQHANVMQHLVLTPGVPAQAEPYLMGMIHTALTYGAAQGQAQANTAHSAPAKKTHEN